MGEKVQIARQDTLLEVQTTGTQTKNTLDVVNGKIGNFGDTAEEGTLFGQMAGGSGSTGTVKSVQRGVSSLPASSSSSEIKITINTINPNKSFVLLTSDATNRSDISYGQGVRLKELAAEYLVVESVYRGYMPFSWQVIELF